MVRSQVEPRCTVETRRNGKLQVAGWTEMALRVLRDKCLAREAVETAIELRRKWAKPKGLVIVRELVSTRSASVSIAEHRKGIKLLGGFRTHRTRGNAGLRNPGHLRQPEMKDVRSGDASQFNRRRRRRRRRRRMRSYPKCRNYLRRNTRKRGVCRSIARSRTLPRERLCAPAPGGASSAQSR